MAEGVEGGRSDSLQSLLKRVSALADEIQVRSCSAVACQTLTLACLWQRAAGGHDHGSNGRPGTSPRRQEPGFKAEVLRREPKFGMFLGSRMDVGLARRLSKGGHDWLAVMADDGSESRCPEEPETIGALIEAIAEGSAKPMVRVARCEANCIRRALELGARGLIIPGVGSAAEAKQAVACCRQPFAPNSGGAAHSVEDIYAQLVRQEILIAIQVDTKACIANIEAIAAVPGVDVLFLPESMARMMAPAEDKEETCNAAVDKLLLHAQKNRNLGKVLGAFLFGTARVEEFVSKGFTFFSIGNDRQWVSSSECPGRGGSAAEAVLQVEPQPREVRRQGRQALTPAGAAEGAATAAARPVAVRQAQAAPTAPRAQVPPEPKAPPAGFPSAASSRTTMPAAQRRAAPPPPAVPSAARASPTGASAAGGATGAQPVPSGSGSGSAQGPGPGPGVRRPADDGDDEDPSDPFFAAWTAVDESAAGASGGAAGGTHTAAEDEPWLLPEMLERAPPAVSAKRHCGAQGARLHSRLQQRCPHTAHCVCSGAGTLTSMFGGLMVVASHHSLAHPSHVEGVAAAGGPRQLTDLGGQNLSGIVMLEQLRFMGLVRLAVSPCPCPLLTCCAVIGLGLRWGGRGARFTLAQTLGALHSSSSPAPQPSCRLS